MLTEIYIEALLVDEDLADQVWDTERLAGGFAILPGAGCLFISVSCGPDFFSIPEGGCHIDPDKSANASQP